MTKTKVEKKESKDSKKEALHYMQTLVDVARESFLILDADLRVILANPVFYDDFKVTPKETIGVLLKELGNGQWDIPELKKLLEEILPEKKDVRDYEVTHHFETIGEKTIVLNAKQVDSVQLIIIAMEDITEKMGLDGKIKELETLNKTMVGREIKMAELKKEIVALKGSRDNP